VSTTELREMRGGVGVTNINFWINIEECRKRTRGA
jgi:hypothetical protein